MTRHRTADLEPTSFGGRYTLIRRLAVGGMAEIYLARQARVWSGGKPTDAPETAIPAFARARSNAEGIAEYQFEKEVVIKRLRAELADDPRIVEMFLDEARIGALLNHPNVVHVYDVDEHDGIPYIAMEYIVGEELNELCRRGIAQDRFLPLEQAVVLMRQAAAGLGYFHSKRGAPGTALADKPLDIVHLDISPSNLLVTQDGFLKVIDFGIARARGRTHHDSVIPGKLSYMSPEQAGRTAVDHRSDIYSLGIVLYEITVGKRLYRGPAHDVVARLVDGTIEPPTFARRNFPPALEAIVMRALERHPEDRYQSAYDLADDLESFLRDERLHSGPVRIARYLDMLAIASGGARRPELVGEAELRGADGRDDLDFDRQAFDGYVPAEGAPGPEQAPEWEDAEQSEADVARALGLELAELRALRTPVPTRPSGVQATRRPPTAPPKPSEQGHGRSPTTTCSAAPRRSTPPPLAPPRRRPPPRGRLRPSPLRRSPLRPSPLRPSPLRPSPPRPPARRPTPAPSTSRSTPTRRRSRSWSPRSSPSATRAWSRSRSSPPRRRPWSMTPTHPPQTPQSPPRPPQPTPRTPLRRDRRPTPDPSRPGARAPRAPGVRDPSGRAGASRSRWPPGTAAARAPGPVIGASMLRASTSSKLPWLLAGVLGLAVAALVAYIAMR